MWGADKKRGGSRAFGGGSTSLIARDAQIIGDVRFSGDLEIQGLVRGNVLGSGEGAAWVRVVEGGRVEGEIHAPRVLINGEVVGDIHCSELVELAGQAKIDGNVHYQLIEMSKGAQVNGSLLNDVKIVSRAEVAEPGHQSG